jgi:hypothetical protein
MRMQVRVVRIIARGFQQENVKLGEHAGQDQHLGGDLFCDRRRNHFFQMLEATAPDVNS